MLNKNIAIVEDQSLVAELLKEYLETLKFHCCGVANTLQKAQQLVKDTAPDLVLLDIDLNGVESGLDLAPFLHQQGVPFIVLSDLQDVNTLQSVMSKNPVQYLEKPVSLVTLRNAIYAATAPTETPNHGSKLQIKDKHEFTLLIPIEDVIYVHSDQGGCEVHYWDHEEQRIIRKVEIGTLTGLHQRLDKDLIWQVHRSFLVNKKFIVSFSGSGLKLQHTPVTIPIGKTYRQQVLKWCQNL